MRKLIILLIILSIISLTRCNSKESNLEPENGIKISAMLSSIGAVTGDEDNFNRQSFSYSVTVQNYDENDFYIMSVEPVLTNQFAKRVEMKEYKVLVNKILPSKQSLTINGKITFNAKGLSKQEIIAIQPVVDGFKISEEHVIKINNNMMK